MPARSATQAKILAENRSARYNYEIEDSFEVGLILTGSEVKALREGRANITESYATIEAGQARLINAYIPTYGPASFWNHAPRRVRTLLMKKRQIQRLMGLVTRKGRTLVPLKLYFNERGLVKLLLGLGVGRRKVDKREKEKKRDWQRQKQRLLRERG